MTAATLKRFAFIGLMIVLALSVGAAFGATG